jgi:hypothetical protein
MAKSGMKVVRQRARVALSGSIALAAQNPANPALMDTGVLERLLVVSSARSDTLAATPETLLSVLHARQAGHSL